MASRLARLLALGLVAGVACAPARAADREVEIRIEHSRFFPGSVQVARGETVRFVVENDDPIDHEFLIGDERVQDIHEKGTEAHHGARPGEISVAALETATTTFTFETDDDLIFGCHLPGHYAYGMQGRIEVR